MAASVEVVDLCASDDDSPVVFSRVARLPVAGANRENLINLLDDDSPRNNTRKRNRQSGGFKTDPNSRQAPATYPNPPPLLLQSPEVQVVGADMQPLRAGLPVPVPQPEFIVLEVFPDADLEHVQKTLERYGGNVPAVMAHFAENSYPKTKSSDSALRPPGGTAGGNATIVRSNRKKFMHDYMSSESFEPSPLYVAQANNQLLFDFPFLSKNGSPRVLAKFRNHYAITHDKIVTAVKGAAAKAGQDLEQVQYRRVLMALSGNRLDNEQTAQMVSLLKYKRIVIKNPRYKSPQPLVTDSTLLDEIVYVKAKLQTWMDVARKRLDREKNRVASQRDGTGVECSCCYDEVDIGDMVACRDEGHLFCVDCLKSFAENQVFGSGNLGIDKETKQPSLELTCFHGDGCSSGFHRVCLEKALPEKVLRKYDELQFQVTIERAGLSDVVTCPQCNFQAALDSSVTVFSCPVEDCRYESCRKCGEASHIPLRCEEVEKQDETKGRLTVEEAISNAKIRKCPKCAKGFIKDDGCNKIRCGCGTFVCYICNAKIKDYSHFCQTPHCQHTGSSCKGKCPLFTKSDEDDARAMREAGLAAAKQVQAATEQVPGGIQIDVDSILKQPAK